MNKFIAAFFFIICIMTQNIYSQIPPNNLGKTKSELKQKFRDLRFTEARNGLEEYESNGVYFTLKNGQVVAECMGVDDGRKVGYEWFLAMNKAFQKTSYTRVTELTNDAMQLSRTFYYPNFWITISHWKDDGYTTVTYQNSNYFK